MPLSRGRRITRGLRLKRSALKRHLAKRWAFWEYARVVLKLHKDNGKDDTWHPTHRKVEG